MMLVLHICLRINLFFNLVLSMRCNLFIAGSDSETEEPAAEPVKLIDTWRQVPSLAQRELGTSPRIYQSYNFRRSVGASIALVERLELQQRLEAHQGCVNALNFNSSGLFLGSDLFVPKN